MRLTARTKIIGASAATALCATALAVATTAGDQGPEPLPFGTPASEWTIPDGREITSLMPETGGVLTMDGKPLRDGNGTLVTASLGEVARGDVSAEAADRQVDRAMLIQAQDACERGLPSPVTAVASGDMPIEEAAARSQENLKRAVAANGGSAWRDACEVLEEIQERMLMRP